MNSNIKVKKGQIEDYAVQKTGDQTVEGQKTFTRNPQVPHTENPNAVVNLEQMRSEMAHTASEVTLDAVLHAGNTSVKNIVLGKPSESNDLAISAGGFEFTNYGSDLDNLKVKWTTPGEGELLGTEIELPKKSGTLAVLEDIASIGLQEVLENNGHANGVGFSVQSRNDESSKGKIALEDSGIVLAGQAGGINISGDTAGISMNSGSGQFILNSLGTHIETNGTSGEDIAALTINSHGIKVLFDRNDEGRIEIENESETTLRINSKNAITEINGQQANNAGELILDVQSNQNLQNVFDKGSEANFSTNLLLRKISNEEGVGNVGEIQITDRIILNNNGGEGITINGHNEPIKLYGLFDIGGYGHTIATKKSEIEDYPSHYLIIGDGNGNNTPYNYLKIGYKDSFSEANTKLKGTNLEIEADGSVKIKGSILNIYTAVVNVDVMGQYSIGSSSNPNFVGMTYDSDYSGHYTDRSIPDVGYLNNQIANAVSETSSFHTLLSSEATLVLTADKNVNYFANTGGATTWTLPPVSGNTGKQIIIVNKGSGNISINTHAGNQELFDGAPLNAMPLISGATYGLYCDGVHWTALY